MTKEKVKIFHSSLDWNVWITKFMSWARWSISIWLHQ